MNQQKIEQIELKTRDILETVLGKNINSIEPPINLGKILENYKLSLSMAGFKNPEVAGAFDASQKTIYLAKNEPPKRQLFTVAHELGHFILNHKKKFDVFYRAQAMEFNGSQNEEEEKQANYFAASLLMPKELVEKFWNKTQDLELLAAYFGVSRSAAYWRLKNLELI